MRESFVSKAFKNSHAPHLLNCVYTPAIASFPLVRLHVQFLHNAMGTCTNKIHAWCVYVQHACIPQNEPVPESNGTCRCVESCVCVSGHIHMCITCSYICSHWRWGLVHIQELTYLWLCMHIPPHCCTCCPSTSYDPVSIYVLVYDQCCSHTTEARGLYNTCTKRTGTHYIYGKVYTCRYKWTRE